MGSHNLRPSRALRSPTQRRKARNGPRPAKRAAAEATLRALNSSHSATAQRRQRPKCRFTTPGARSSRSVPHSPPARRVRAIQLAVTPLAVRARLHCFYRAASGARANSMALGTPRRRRRCSQPRVAALASLRRHIRRTRSSIRTRRAREVLMPSSQWQRHGSQHRVQC